MHYLLQHIEQYLMSCRELTAFCSQNGWIDKETLCYEILEENDHHIIAFVQFEEIIMEGSGRIAGRIPCQGRLCLTLDRYGQVSHAELL
ncbi:MAG: hypothetical protein ACE5FQ_08870 [Thiogranum sp.]